MIILSPSDNKLIQQFVNLKEKLAQNSCSFSWLTFVFVLFCICVFGGAGSMGVLFPGWTFVLVLDTRWVSGHSPLPSKHNALHTEPPSHPICSLLFLADHLFSWPSVFPVKCFIFPIEIIALKTNNCFAKGFLKPFCMVYSGPAKFTTSSEVAQMLFSKTESHQIP